MIASVPRSSNNLYKTVLYSFASSDFDSAVTDLSDYLPRLSAKGSGDDVSIAAVLDRIKSEKLMQSESSIKTRKKRELKKMPA